MISGSILQAFTVRRGAELSIGLFHLSDLRHSIEGYSTEHHELEESKGISRCELLITLL